MLQVPAAVGRGGRRVSRRQDERTMANWSMLFSRVCLVSDWHISRPRCGPVRLLSIALALVLLHATASNRHGAMRCRAASAGGQRAEMVSTGGPGEWDRLESRPGRFPSVPLHTNTAGNSGAPSRTDLSVVGFAGAVRQARPAGRDPEPTQHSWFRVLRPGEAFAQQHRQACQVTDSTTSDAMSSQLPRPSSRPS